MAKEKKSFLERITGSRRVEEEDTSIEMTNEDEEQTVNPLYEEEEAPMRTNVRADKMPAESTQEDWMSNAGDGEGQLTIDVYQTDTDIVIKSTIAGVKPEDLDVSINNDMVTVRGERKNEEEVEEENFYYQECYWGTFSRSVILPVDVIADKAEASMKNGILTIRLPKAETNKSKKIQVRGF